MIFNKGPLKKGILRVNKKGFGFIEIEGQEEDLFISIDNMNNAIHEDVVVAEIIERKADGRIEGRIVKILSHKTNHIVGEFIKDKRRIMYFQMMIK